MEFNRNKTGIKSYRKLGTYSTFRLRFKGCEKRGFSYKGRVTLIHKPHYLLHAICIGKLAVYLGISWNSISTKRQEINWHFPFIKKWLLIYGEKSLRWKFVHSDYLESDYYQSNQTLEYMLAIILFDCRDWPYVRDFFSVFT